MYQIMLVEDEMLVRESMAQNTNWDKFGFAPPHVFENGRQALEQLESVLPDVVITDICMPFVDGLELARNIYEKFPDTIVVVLTGFSEFSYAQKAIRYHVHDYLLKPVSPKEFDQLLENLSAELSRRDNRQGLYSRAVLADEVLKDHFFQGLLQSDTAQELPEATLAAGVELGGRFHAVALAALPQRPEGFDAQGHRVAQGCAPAQLRLLGDQHVMLIVSGDETAELMARTAAGARHLRAVMQEAEITARAKELLKVVHLSGKEDLEADNLPYGEQRRLEIARALATDMKLLLLDEPAAGMNPTETEELLEIINYIRNEFKVSVLLIEHDMSLVMKICERIQVLDFGTTIASGTPEQIANDPHVIEAYLGKDEPEEAAHA